jgi:hypothetical protein
VSELLRSAPYAQREEAAFLREMTALTRHHLEGCSEYRRIWSGWQVAESAEQLPFVHVGLFKLLDLRTLGNGIQHQRTLNSSSTSGMGASQIVMDGRSSRLQGESSIAILKDFVGEGVRPLVVLDSPRALRTPAMSARIAAALSLKPLAKDMFLVLEDSANASTIRWQQVLDAVAESQSLLVYGFTYLLWQAWEHVPAEVASELKRKRIHFVHSGGWKKLEYLNIDRATFDARMLAHAGAGSAVVDFYGLVEQVGVVYPQCSEGFRHAPAWAEAIVRDPYTLLPLVDEPGQLQLMNALSWGAPYHNVLTEDMARVVSGSCACGRQGTRFELLGRMPKAELRGCANV